MLCKVAPCTGHISTNTKPRLPCWGDLEVGAAISSTNAVSIMYLAAYIGTQQYRTFNTAELSKRDEHLARLPWLLLGSHLFLGLQDNYFLVEVIHQHKHTDLTWVFNTANFLDGIITVFAVRG